MKLWGKDYTRQQLEALTGDLRQIADIELQTRSEGTEAGTRQAWIRTGAGLDFPVHLDKGMDLGHATFRGIPLTWHSPSGPAHPHRAELEGAGWLRGFSGGLLSLCGLTNAGPPSRDTATGETIGLHGRIGATQARRVSVESRWEGDEWKLVLKGTMEEAALFRHRLTLERTLEVIPGVPGFRMNDRIRNFGGEPAPLMLLYHCNFGWPLLSPEARLISPATKVLARDTAAQSGLEHWSEFGPPVAGWKEQVFFHQLPESQKVTATLENRPLGIAIDLSFNSGECPLLTQWKQTGYGDYVLGIEPGNCLPIGQEAAAKAGNLPWLAPGETKEVHLEFLVRTL